MLQRTVILTLAGLTLGMSVPGTANAQSIHPDPGYVFNDTLVPRIDILIDTAHLSLILSEPESNTEYPAIFIFSTPARSDTVENTGFRIRGNTSRWSAKKSWKVSFNSFTPGRKFRGLEKMNINGEHNDPSLIRAKICWDMMRFMEIPASRANHVELYINHEYTGLHLNVEHIDEEFVRSRFGDLHGNLYKCLWPADLAYLGEDPDKYKFKHEERKAYELKTNVIYDDYADLARFIGVLDMKPGAEFACSLKEAFNVGTYLKIMAVDVLTGNWDNYIWLKNNYYLYLNPGSGRLEFIPYDMDNTFGVDWFGVDWMNRDLYNWSNEEPRPLYEKLMSVPEFRDQYSYYLRYLLDNYFNYGKLNSSIYRLHNMIRPYVLEDPHYPLDYGYTIEAFDRSLSEAAGDHVRSGIFPFLNQRAASARSQLETNPPDPVIQFLDWNQPGTGDTLSIRVKVEDDDLKDVNLMFALFDGPFEELPLYDDGLHGDGLEGDGTYGIRIVHEGWWDADFYISASDSSGHQVDYPCNPIYLTVPIHSGSLVINEFMAGNDSVISDEAGEYDDWIEIANIGSEPEWLGNRFLSDDLSTRDKWKMPDAWLNPREFIIIWADGQEEQGDNHAGFRLNRDGEEIGLFDAPSTGFRLIDRIIYTEQATDVSYARSVDGENQWTAMAEPTPGYSNHIPLGLSEFVPGQYPDKYPGRSPNQNQESTLRVYPNPVSGEWIYFSRISSGRITDLNGRSVLQFRDQEQTDVGSLVPGLYLVLFKSGKALRLVRY